VYIITPLDPPLPSIATQGNLSFTKVSPVERGGRFSLDRSLRKPQQSGEEPLQLKDKAGAWLESPSAPVMGCEFRGD